MVQTEKNPLSSVKSETQTLCEFLASIRYESLPNDVVSRTEDFFLDWLGSGLAGKGSRPVLVLEQFAKAMGPASGPSEILTTRGRTSPFFAALINGAASHSVEFDDIYRDAGYHPGSPTISAALAAAQASGASGDRFLRGVIVGYEISTRIGEAVMPSHYKYWHTTGTVGAFGAAAAAATILGANKEQFMHAMATVGSFASGLQQAFRSQAMTKPLHGGHAADAGCWAAMAAMKGLTGALDMLEGEVGFGNAMSVNPDWSKATKGLGVDYHINQMTFKNHGCCGHTFPSIDGALHLQQQHGFTHKDVKHIKLHTYKAGLNIIDNNNPEGEYQAKFSIQYTVAHALVRGSVRLNAFDPDHLSDPDVRALLKKIEPIADPEISAGYPNRRESRVEIELNDGRKFEHFQPYRKGDPELPLTDDELNGKFIELAEPVIGKAGAASLLKQLWDTEKLANVDYDTGAGVKRAAG